MSTVIPLDHVAIQNTIARYCVALDTKDWELLSSSVFTKDVSADYPFNKTMSDVKTVANAIKNRLGEVITQHALTTQIIEVNRDGKTASAETYFTGNHFGHGKYEGQVLVAYGKYVDQLVCTGQGQGTYREWRIKKRTVVFMKRIGDEHIMDH
ncbi:hypothetical protein LTS18_002067 [Coniosporium uncinatum]|uniref:Uncharacterized protein n=1 Tax=Coniosporium uncinatum TaxID=93489 RepID=A0ACC3D7R2_9PEZI|nr:hypothetical protein LTS18_002067 [Coniosporium uncinatum]